MRVGAVQCRVGVSEAFKSAEKLISEGDCDLYLLPEYFSYRINDISLETSKKTLKWLRDLSKEFSTTIAGNVVRRDEHYYNSLYIYKDGELIGYQDKIHPTKSERNLGIKCGREIRIFEIDKVKISALICADILYPELSRIPALKGAEIILNPVVSFKHSELPAEEFRYCLYFTRSFDNAYAVVKAGGVGYTFLGDECVGRSLISTHRGILAKYRDENSEELISAEIDLDDIREYKRINYSLHDRNTKALAELLDGGIEC